VKGERVAKPRALPVEAQPDLAIRALLDNLGVQIAGELDAIARMQAARPFGIGLPAAAAEIARQGDLNGREASPADEAGRDHLRVVEHQEIARSQQLWQSRDVPVGY